MEDMLPFQGLRGVCAMAIFLGHQTELVVASPWRAPDHHPLLIGLEYLQAVSLFFLLSGIPLARLYSTKVQTPEGKVTFWRKRFARLAPIYYLTLILNLVVLLMFAGWTQVDLKAAFQSFAGCSLLLQSFFVMRFITVGGVLWQVAVFAYGYAIFPFVILRITHWTDKSLYIGIVFLWAFSLGLWAGVFFLEKDMQLMAWWVWHVHCLSRLPHVMAGIFLGELVERKRQQDNQVYNWARWTDVMSLILALTAIQAPLVEWYYGTEVRSEVSIGLQAVMLPLHALWLAGLVLAYNSPTYCWTRTVLSFRPLVKLGDVSLVLYCLHLVVMFVYTAVYNLIQTGEWHIMLDNYILTVQVPWWHMPAHWVIVVGVSFAVSNWFEAPMRKILATPRAAPSGEAASLLPTESGNAQTYSGST